MSRLDKFLSDTLHKLADTLKPEYGYDLEFYLENNCMNKIYFKNFIDLLQRLELINNDQWFDIRSEYGNECENWDCSICH